MTEWWRDPRCHFGRLDEFSPLLRERVDLQPAIEFISSQLCLEKGMRVLDLCCGPGRYAIELAHRGFDVVGIDLNEDYIALARKVADREKLTAGFLVADTRQIPFVNYFDAIINVGTSFGFFDAQADNQRVIEAVAVALRPGGHFLLEMGNRDFLLKNFVSAESRENEDGTVTAIDRSFDYVHSRIHTSFERSSRGESLEKWSHSWRAYTLTEVVSLLAQSDLDLVAAFGGWQCEEYGVDSMRMVVVSRRQPAV